jgi:methylaspartate ammonia-lyase
MSTIADLIVSEGLGGFFFDDQAAIKAGAVRDGNTYRGVPLTPGFASVREPAQTVSLQLILDDGYVARGDCASVQYTGVGGREPRFHAPELAAAITRDLAPALKGLDVRSFRDAASTGDELVDSAGLGRAAAYGLSQALLDAAAHAAGHHLMARVIQDEWRLPGPLRRVPVYAQTGDDRHTGVDKMILKAVDVLPHGLINTRELVGTDGDALVDYVTWLTRRVQELSPHPDYTPVIHLDVYGQIGAVVAGDVDRSAEILQRLERAAAPHQLRVEHPIHAPGRDVQIEILGELSSLLRSRGATVQFIADEWANTAEDIHLFAASGAVDLIQIKTPDLGALHNTVDAILDCKAHGVGPILGGTCAESDLSARATTHVGVATGVTQMLAKPGMGVDEGLMIVTNEMNRALAVDRHLHAARAQHDEERPVVNTNATRPTILPDG